MGIGFFERWSNMSGTEPCVINLHILCSGKQGMELGCGAGLVGVCLARVSVQLAVLTDGQHEALQNCTHNLRINGVKYMLHNHPGDVDIEQRMVCSLFFTHHYYCVLFCCGHSYGFFWNWMHLMSC